MSIFEELEFNQNWLELEIIDSDKLNRLKFIWEQGEDKNPEHYRWRAFCEFLQTKEHLDEKVLRALYRLGEIDKDKYGVGVSIRIEILQRENCPKDLFARALEAEEKNLRNFAIRQLSRE